MWESVFYSLFPSSAVHFSPFCSLVWAGLTIFAPSLVRGSGFGEALFGVCSPAFFTDFIRAFTHMSCILLIDTSTAACSVALCEDTQVIYADEDTQGPNHNVLLGSFVDQALSFADSHAIPVDAVAVSSGPGSYTGLRIGVSMAKGVAYGLGVPLIGVPTLKVMATPVLLYQEEELPDDALLCPMIDARRMEVYFALYDRALAEHLPVQAQVVTPELFLPFLEKGPVYFFGTGAEKCKAVLTHSNARFVDGILPLARHMAPLAERAYLRGEFADTAYFEPYYLKDFVAGKSRDMLKETR